MKVYKIGILGCGHIAEKMAATLNEMKGVECYAVASRSKEKAQRFADKWNFSKAYGSYEELADDADTDLIYIATPHSQHYENAMMCIEFIYDSVICVMMLNLLYCFIDVSVLCYK